MSRKPAPVASDRPNQVEVPNEIGETVVDLTGAPSAHPDDRARPAVEFDIVDLTAKSKT